MKYFNLLIISFLVLSFSGTYAQEKPSAIIKKASVAPVIGGEIDAVWDEANVYNIDQPFQSETPTLGASGETTWQALWTYEGLYILLRVTDDDFYPYYAVYPEGNWWEYDSPEIYIDVNSELEDGEGPASTYSNGHYQIAPRFKEPNDGTAITDENNVVHAFVVDDPNYTAEYFIPYSVLLDKDGVEVDKTAEIGFDVAIQDSDEGKTLRQRAVWANTGTTDESWNNMDDCGIITLEGAEEITPVTSLSISGGTIDTDNGTLQITADIQPEDASIKKVSWIIIPVTGRAKVDENGLVTALVDGEVTVKAVSMDGSFIEATASVIISNQDVTREDISLIRNGNFKEVNDNGFPEEWEEEFAENKAFVQDGYVVLDPKPDGSNPWDYRFQQTNFGCNSTDTYTFSFVAWADEERTFNVDFEDPFNSYNRYGTSTHEYATGGESDWTFNIGTVPVKYEFDVVFNEMLENTEESLNFMLGLSGSKVYLDSVILYNNNDLALITNGTNPVTYDTVHVTIYDTTYVTVYDTIAVTDTLIIDVNLANDPFSRMNEIKIYPNPANDHLMIRTGNYDDLYGYKIKIVDSQGVAVFDNFILQENYDINLNNWSGKGLYFVQLINPEGILVTTKKIILQ